MTTRMCSRKNYVRNQEYSYERKIDNIKFIIGRKNFAETLNAKGKALNLIPIFVKFSPIFSRRFSVFLRRHDRNKPLLNYSSSGFVVLVSTVHNQMALSATIKRLDKFSAFRCVVAIFS